MKIVSIAVLGFYLSLQALAQNTTRAVIPDSTTGAPVNTGDTANKAIRVNVVAGAGASGGTSSTYGLTFPTVGTAVGFQDTMGNMSPGLLDASGFLKVNVAAGSGSNPAASATGAAVPASADYQGVNVAGTLRGQTAVNPSGSIYAAQQDIASVAGTTIDTNSGNKSAGTIRVTIATDQVQPTNAFKVDGSAVTQPVSGTFWQATQPVSNAGTFAVQATLTAETTKVIGTVNQGTSPWIVAGGGTAGSAATGVVTIQGIASMTKLLVTPDANSAVNVAQINGVTPLMGTGNTGTGSIRVTIATDQAQLTNKLLVTPDANSAVNVAQINGVTVLMGNGASGTGAQRVTIANDSTGILAAVTSITNTVTVAGAKTNNNAAPGATNVGVLPYIANAAVQTWTEGNLVAGSVDLSGNLRIIPGATAVTANAALGCYLVSAASTNSTNCKNASGNVYGYRFINTTATLYYLRMYNSSSAPTCSSATGFIESIPIPANTSGAGLIDMSDIPIGYTTGISFCFTGGSSSTDNTNAATGVFGVIKYK